MTAREKKQEEVYPLSQMYFYLTEGCNLVCRHCWLSPKFDPNGDRHATLPVEVFETAIREAKPLGLARVKLTGGEPLLHPQFTKLLEIVRREELALAIETNGMLLTPKIAAEISRLPDRHVSVSIDGADAETHDWIRGVKGCFTHAQQAARNLAAADTPPQIIMTLMQCNADQMDHLVRMAESLGASSVKFNLVQPTGRGETMHEGTNGLDVAALIQLGQHVDTELASSTKLPLFFDYPLAFRPLSRIAKGDGCSICGVLGILGVLATGHYALCGIGEHVPELVFGKVAEGGIENVWKENATLKALRDGLPERLRGVCACCLMKHRCLGSCVAQNYYRRESFWEPFWFCEQAADDGLFPQTRLNGGEVGVFEGVYAGRSM